MPGLTFHEDGLETGSILWNPGAVGARGQHALDFEDEARQDAGTTQRPFRHTKKGENPSRQARNECDPLKIVGLDRMVRNRPSSFLLGPAKRCERIVRKESAHCEQRGVHQTEEL